jgi:hypothetical protein
LPHLRFFHVLLPRSRSTTTLCMSTRIAYEYFLRCAMSTGCCFSCSRRGIAKRVEATFSRYLLFRDYAPVPAELHLGRLRIPALSFGAK